MPDAPARSRNLRPRATYRLQFHADFPFSAGRDLAPYLAAPLALGKVKDVVGYLERRAYEAPELDKILQHAAAKHYGVRSLVHEVVQSDLFRKK